MPDPAKDFIIRNSGQTRSRRTGGLKVAADKKIRISQCMIVKNEERNIERALSWGKDIMCEQIVVDTGSTDRTVELAEKVGASVYFYEWTDDFAAAKNYAIGKAKGDWIAFLDADEYMTPEDARTMQTVLDGSEERNFDGISTGWQQLDDKGQIFSSGTQIRFFRNHPDIRYRRRIHEQLEASDKRALHIGDVVNDISIFHTGYQTVSVEGKSSRNRKLILKELEDNPEDYEMMGYIGDECFDERQWTEAERWYRRAVQYMPAELDEYDQRSAFTFTRLLTILFGREETSLEEITKLYDRAVQALPKEADLDYMMGRFFASRGQADPAVRYLEAAVEKLNTYGCNNKALLLAGNLLEAYGLLVRCCQETGAWESCVHYAVTCLKYEKYNMAVLSDLMKALLSSGNAENGAVLEFLTKIYDTSILKDRLFLVKTAERSNLPAFAAFAAERFFTQEERERLGL